MSRHLVAIGADGCPGGWIAACDYGDATELRRFDDVAELAAWREGWFDDPPVALDVPMGLPPEPGLRACDRAARALLGPRRSSIFQPPARRLFGARSFEDVQRRVRERGSPGLSRQAFRIMPKVCEVDRFLAWHGDCQDWLFEVHPETSFTRIAGCPLGSSKQAAGSRQQRRRLLNRLFPDMTLRFGGVSEHDVLDAYAALWTARRIAEGTAERLGGCERDAAGLVMRIVV